MKRSYRAERRLSCARMPVWPPCGWST